MKARIREIEIPRIRKLVRKERERNIESESSKVDIEAEVEKYFMNIPSYHSASSVRLVV